MLVGIAASTALLVGVFGGSVVAKELGLRQALGDLPPRDRSFRVDPSTHDPVLIELADEVVDFVRPQPG